MISETTSAAAAPDRADWPTWRRSPTLSFLAEVFRSPFATGAIAPSSGRLARIMVRAAAVKRAANILELGPGTGVVTREILRSRQPGARVLAIEHSAQFVTDLSLRHPELTIVEGCASRLREHAARHRMDAADTILSGLPWTILPADLQMQILRAAHDLLTPGGTFATFACFGPHLTPSGRRFRERLDAVFPVVRTSRVVWQNLPPAFVYCGSKQVAPEPSA